MEPVEINAGAWYLRALRDDDRLSDATALTDLGIDDPSGYVAESDSRWAAESEFVWAVCIPTTGELVALIGVTNRAGAGDLWEKARTGFDDALDAARGPVTRFAEGALGLSLH